MNPHTARLSAWSVLAATALLLAGCSRNDAPAEPIRAVKIMTVGTSSLESMHEFSGEVKPRIESQLGFRVAGKLIRRQVDLGQRVHAGQVLAQLDPQDYKLAAEAAKAQVAAAQTNRDFAAADFKRYQALKAQNFIAGAEVDRRESTLKAAQAQLEQAQAQLATQSNQARYTDLVADTGGVVTAVLAEPGQVVAAGTPVVRIAEDGPRDVVFSVPEDKVRAVRADSLVAVRFWSTKETLPGRIREVGASADPITRTYTIKVSLDPKAQPPLGATVSVLPQDLGPTGIPVIKLPTSALRQEGKGTAVWVLDRGTMTVRSQPVEVTTADGNEAVIASGLQPGMLVVSAGVHVLAPGQKVTIWQPRSVPTPTLASQALPAPSAGTAQAATLPPAR